MHINKISVLIHTQLDMFGMIICFVEVKYIEMVETDMALSTSWSCGHATGEKNRWSGNTETEERGRRWAEV